VVSAEALLLDSLPAELDSLEDSVLLDGVLDVVEDSVSVLAVEEPAALEDGLDVSEELASPLEDELPVDAVLAFTVLAAVERRLAAASSAGSWPEASCT
jgi:hypothetical protein